MVIAFLAKGVPGKGTGVLQTSAVTARNATVCALSQQPAAWNHVRVRVSGTATSGTERIPGRVTIAGCVTW